MRYLSALMRLMMAPVLLSGFNGTANAIDFIAKAAIGYKSSELIIRDRSFTPDFITLDLALTGTIDRYFLTIENEVSIKDAIESVPDGDGDGVNDGLIFYSRQDTNITFGYGFDIATVFIGWRSGETTSHYTAENNEFGTKSDGFYIGTSKSHYFENKGNLSGSIAIASLDGEVSLTEPFVDTSAFIPGVGSTPPDTIKGSAIGFSLGIGWSGQVSDNTIYNIDYKLNQFDFEDDVVFGGLDLSYEENFSTFYIGLTHFFD